MGGAEVVRRVLAEAVREMDSMNVRYSHSFHR